MNQDGATMTASTPATRRPGHRPDTVLARVVTRTALRQGTWVWAIAIAATFGISLLVGHYGGTPLSVLSTAVQGPRWYLFVMLLVIVLASIGPSVAHGMTRRSFTRQVCTGAVLAALGYGLVASLVHAAERALFLTRGWDHVAAYGRRAVPAGPWALVAVDHAVVLATFALSGVAVAAVFYRWGGWAGTLALPVTAGPVLVVPALVAHVEPVELGNAVDTVPYPAGLALALAVCAALWGLAHLALRGARVRPTTTS